MKTLETDVVIVAAGPAGLCAAVAAAEGGAEVIVFEKTETCGGTANMGMGPFGVESRLQKRNMIDLTKEDAFRRFMDYVHWKADAQLVHDYIWKSGDTIDWLEDMGVVFAGVEKNFPQSEYTWHVVQPAGGGRPGPRAASTMNKIIYERALELGVTFYFNTPVYELIKEDDEVIGCRARSNDGEEYEVMAGAVIVACGGFGTNPDMVKEYTGFTMGKDMFKRLIPGIEGDGVKMCWAAGAGKSRMEMELVVGQALPGAGTGEYPQTMAFRQACPIAVNLSGFRVCDESVMQNATIGANIIEFQQNKCVYMLLSDSILEHFRKEGIDYPSGVFHDDPCKDFEAVWEGVSSAHPDLAAIADTPAELAEKLHIDIKNLSKTIEQYNHFCQINCDENFGKQRRYLVPLTGKLYAYRLNCGAYGSLGGIKINHRLEVLTQDYQVIRGLYAAGTDVCDIYAGTYYYYFPGNTMGFALNTGRMAGEYAARFALGYDD